MTETTITRHGNLVVIEEIGTFITGAPGIGKSELSLALIDRGHVLVSDDAVEFQRQNDALVGSCPEPILGFMQIDHVGLINIIKLYGETVCIPQHVVHINIALEDSLKISNPVNAFKPTESTCDYLGIPIPTYHLPLNIGKQIPLLVEILVRNFKLLQNGYSAYKDLQQKQRALMQRKSQWKQKNSPSSINSVSTPEPR